MDTGVLIALIVIVVLVVAVVAFFANRGRRSSQLQERFGDEYDRTVDERGDRREAEAELAGREKRRSQLDIRPLEPESRDRYTAAWRQTQESFVDSPSSATREADLLVVQVMRERGYPMDDFEQRSADISVDHPEVVNDYRTAHRVSLANDNGEASTEDLREAMVHYRALFVRLLGSPNEEARR